MHACMDVCVYVCIGIEINTCVSGYAHVHIHIHFGKHVYMFIPRHTYTYIHVYIYIYISSVCTAMGRYTYACMCTFSHRNVLLLPTTEPPETLNPKTLNPSAPKASPHKEQPGGRLDDVDADHLVKGEKDGGG